MPIISNHILSIIYHFFSYLESGDNEQMKPTTNAIIEIYNAINAGKSLDCVSAFDVGNEFSRDKAINAVRDLLTIKCSGFDKLYAPVSHFLHEITDNIVEHSNAAKGYVFGAYDLEADLVDIVVSDGGKSIFGSYVDSDKYLDDIGNSDAKAINLAKDGFSTKDLPDAENRGYGISSNIRRITKGLKGSFAILSGNAIFVAIHNQTEGKTKTLTLNLPGNIEWKGTLVLASIPQKVPADYNDYDYYQ